MSWAVVADSTDATVSVILEDLETARGWVLGVLADAGVDPAEVPAPNPVLRDLQLQQALSVACYRLAAGQDSGLIDKGDRHAGVADRLAKRISRRALGLDTTTGGASGLGVVSIGRS